MAAERHRLQPRKQPRQVRAELTRQRILEAAAHVFAEHGYVAGTTDRIAERARVSIGSLYQYYPNKDAILLELVTKHLEDGAASIRAQQRQALPNTLEAVLRMFVSVSIENHQTDPQLLRVMAEQAPRSAELLRKVTESHEARIAYMSELLRQYPEVGVERVDLAARIVVSTIELVVHQVTASEESVDLREFEDELVAMFTRYLTTAQS